MSAIYCPKCESGVLYQERDRDFEPDPWILVCHTCGYRLYGEKSIMGLIKGQAPHLLEVFCAHIAVNNTRRHQLYHAPPARPPQPGNHPRRGRVLVHCAFCGTGIWRRPYDIRTSPNKRFFCSLEHLTAFKRQDVDVQKNDAGTSSRRSHSKCRHEKNRQQKPPARRRGAVMVRCTVCDTEIWRRPWDVRSCKSGRFFCSRKHYVQYRRSIQHEDTDTLASPQRVDGIRHRKDGDSIHSHA